MGKGMRDERAQPSSAQRSHTRLVRRSEDGDVVGGSRGRHDWSGAEGKIRGPRRWEQATRRTQRAGLEQAATDAFEDRGRGRGDG
jgi:hypothetical protein